MINLIQIQKIIENFFKNQSLVGSVKLGSVYDNLNTGNLKYPVLNIDHIDTVHNNFDTYNFYIYFADRLTENHNNSNYVVTSGINIMKMFTKYMEDNFSMQTPVTITPFVQKFADDCAGVWTRVSIEVRDDIDYCADEINVPTLYIVENGEHNVIDYDKVIVNVQGSGGGIPEAPIDGKIYGRKNADWAEIEEGDKQFPFEYLYQHTHYLYEAKYNNEDYTWAKEVLKNKYLPMVGCSSVRNGQFIGRNYDWYYSNAVSFVVRTERNGVRVNVEDENDKYRYKVLGVAGGLNELTDQLVQSGEYSDYYKLLPFLICDGINEHGLTCNVNVVPNDKGNTSGTTPLIEQREEICGLMLVRYILDNFTKAIDAINYIKNYVKVYMPNNETFSTELHFMISDTYNSDNTYVLEFVNNEVVYRQLYRSVKPIVTNFHLNGVTLSNSKVDYLTSNIEDHGQGLERYNLIADNYTSLTSAEAMLSFLANDLKFTNAYGDTENPRWKTEFVGNTQTFGDLKISTPIEDFAGIFAYCDNLYENRTREEQNTWQTIHTSVYDNVNKSLIIVNQEQNINTKLEFTLESDFVTREELETGLSTKQDTISDLATIRSGAALGATALQEVPDIYAKKSDIPTVPTFTFDSATATLNITL